MLHRPRRRGLFEDARCRLVLALLLCGTAQQLGGGAGAGSTGASADTHPTPGVCPLAPAGARARGPLLRRPLPPVMRLRGGKDRGAHPSKRRRAQQRERAEGGTLKGEMQVRTMGLLRRPARGARARAPVPAFLESASGSSHFLETAPRVSGLILEGTAPRARTARFWPHLSEETALRARAARFRVRLREFSFLGNCA